MRAVEIAEGQRVRILVTGIGGFAGQHLARHLLNADTDAELVGVASRPLAGDLAAIPLHAVDLRDEAAVVDLLDRVRPDQIYHLAGSAYVRQSFDTPWDTLENNVRSQLNLFLAMIRLQIAPRVLAVTSGEIYSIHHSDKTPLDENAPIAPASPYSVSKAAQDMLAQQYTLSHHLPILRARPFNHLGPGQALGFVAPDFAMQIARIEAGLQPPVMRVGDLTAERDFTDVRDTVRAYHLLMQHGTPGEAYNIASGKTVPVQTLLNGLLERATADIAIKFEGDLMRPASARRSCGDASKMRTATGWTPDIPLAQTLGDVLDDCRQRVAMLKVESPL